MFNKLDHIIYFVNDLERAKKFYSEKLGLPIINEYPDFVKIKLPGESWLALHPSEMNGKDIGRGGFFYLDVDDISKTIDELRRREIKIVHEISDVPSGRIATIHDSEGNAIGLFESKKGHDKFTGQFLNDFNSKL